MSSACVPCAPRCALPRVPTYLPKPLPLVSPSFSTTCASFSLPFSSHFFRSSFLHLRSTLRSKVALRRVNSTYFPVSLPPLECWIEALLCRLSVFLSATPLARSPCSCVGRVRSLNLNLNTPVTPVTPPMRTRPKTSPTLPTHTTPTTPPTRTAQPTARDSRDSREIPCVRPCRTA